MERLWEGDFVSIERMALYVKNCMLMSGVEMREGDKMKQHAVLFDCSLETSRNSSAIAFVRIRR